HILGGGGSNASSYPRFKLSVSLIPLGFNGAHDSCVELLVVTMNCKVEAQVPGYEQIKMNIRG
ncbi:MAG: hypothetical protein QXP59_04720, partial [Saccharolobus sp.]